MPGVLCLCKKSELAMLHANFLQCFPEEDEFIPETFVLPRDRHEAVEILSTEKTDDKQCREAPSKNNLWILKPCIKSGDCIEMLLVKNLTSHFTSKD